MGWCCVGGNPVSLSRRVCALKNGAFYTSQDTARRQCTPDSVIR